ncbi:MAG: hypothetical protein WC506_04630 [Candidatus Micrarchaeia archaeon]
MEKIEELEIRLAKIEARNSKVEADKAWETSLLRRSLIALFTYLAIGAYLAAIRVSDPWLNAVVPTVAFLLSTLVLPFAKDFWLARGK